MQNSHGFTLVEVIFTTSIIIILSLFTLRFAITKVPYSSIDQQCQRIIGLLQEAKTKALLNHERIDILIENNQISYDHQGKYIVKLDSNCYIQDMFELYFNKNGNINSGNHLNVCNQEKCKSIIFNVGSGAFYVQE